MKRRVKGQKRDMEIEATEGHLGDMQYMATGDRSFGGTSHKTGHKKKSGRGKRKPRKPSY